MESDWPEIRKHFQQGNQVAFAHVYNRFIDVLFRYGSKICANEHLVLDAIQEVFIDLYLRREKIASDPAHVKYYLLLALKRNIFKKIHYNRKHSTNKISDKIYFDSKYTADTVLLEKEDLMDNQRKISHLLKDLSSKEKEALYLKFNESLDYPEIAQIMNITVESVRKQVYRAIKKIRKIIDIQGIVFFFTFFSKKQSNICP